MYSVLEYNVVVEYVKLPNYVLDSEMYVHPHLPYKQITTYHRPGPLKYYYSVLYKCILVTAAVQLTC